MAQPTGKARKSIFTLAVLIAVACSLTACDTETAPGPDVIVVGTGIAGMSSALEMARGGAHVQVVDMWSVFGSHAVMSTGGLSIVGSATRRKQGIADSPELARRDFPRSVARDRPCRRPEHPDGDRG
jgi:predicted oxidoreductase